MNVASNSGTKTWSESQHTAVEFETMENEL